MDAIERLKIILSEAKCLERILRNGTCEAIPRRIVMQAEALIADMAPTGHCPTCGRPMGMVPDLQSAMDRPERFDEQMEGRG
jgi:hypothetical protein